MAHDMTLENLPPYLRSTAFGFEVQRGLRSRVRPNWVQESLIFRQKQPKQGGHASKQANTSARSRNASMSRRRSSVSAPDASNARIGATTNSSGDEHLDSDHSNSREHEEDSDQEHVEEDDEEDEGSSEDIIEPIFDDFHDDDADDSYEYRSPFVAHARNIRIAAQLDRLDDQRHVVVSASFPPPQGESPIVPHSSGTRRDPAELPRVPIGSLSFASTSSATRRSSGITNVSLVDLPSGSVAVASHDEAADAAAATERSSSATPKPKTLTPISSFDRLNLSSLPSSWDLRGKNSVKRIAIEPEGLQISERHTSEVLLRATSPIPRLVGTYYFEVHFDKICESGSIAVGFCTQAHPLQELAANGNVSWGYYGDDGRIIGPQTSSRKFGSGFGAGDVVGCGIDFETRSVFFTKNGYALGQAFKDITISTDRFYPFFGTRPATTFVTNFGQTHFRYDIKKHMHDHKLEILKRIDDTKAPSTSQLHQSIMGLIGDYLSQAGYKQSAAAFDREMRKQADGDIVMSDAGSSNGDESAHAETQTGTEAGTGTVVSEDAARRTRWRDLIFSNKASEVVSELNRDFATLLQQNPRIHIDLLVDQFAQALGDPNELEHALEVGQLLVEQDKDLDSATQEKLHSVMGLFALEDASEQIAAILSDETREELVESLSNAVVAARGVYESAELPRLVNRTLGILERLSQHNYSSAHLNFLEDFL